MMLRKRIIEGTALNFIATAFNQGSTLITNVIVARILMKEVFGEYAMVQSTLLMAATLTQLATGYTASKYVAEYRSYDPEKAGRIMGLCSIVSLLTAGVGCILLALIAPWLSASLMNAPHLEKVLLLGLGYLFFSSVNGYQVGALSGLEAYRSLAVAGAGSGIMALALITAGALTYGLAGALMGLSLSAFIRCMIHGQQLRRESRSLKIIPQYRNVGQEKSIIWKYALPSSIAGYYALPMIWFGSSLLVRQPDGYSEMALYAAAMNIKSVVLFMPVIVNGVTSSVLNNMKGVGKTHLYDKLYRSNVIAIFLAAFIVSLFFGIFGDHILNLFGRSFTTAKNILIIVLISSVFEATTSAVYQQIQIYEKIWLSLVFINIPLGPLFLAVGFFTIPKLGALGLGLAGVVMNAMSLLVTSLIAASIFRRNEQMSNA